MHPRTAPLPFRLLAILGVTNAAIATHLLISPGPGPALGVAMLAVSLATLGAGWVLAARVTAPLAQLAQSLGAVARGERVVAIPGLGRTDEIGAMATAIALIRDRATPPPARNGNPATDLPAAAADIAAESVAELHQPLGRITAGPAAAIERRASLRVPLRRGAMLELAGRRAVAVNLLDLSEGGAALDATETGAAVGMEGSLVFGTNLMPMRVVALGQDRIHVAFTALSPEARMTIRQMTSGAEQALAA
jgi:methyl-accepting chemotaxis protein